MHLQERRVSCCTVSGIIALFTSLLLVLSACVEAAETTPPQLSSPMRNRQYHVHYDVNADGTYTEQDELAIIVLNDMGVQISGRMPVRMPNSPVIGSREPEVEILNAYTLKQNGERINALPWKPQQGASAMPASPVPQMQVKMMSFQKVEIGDTLIVSYKVMLKKTTVPNNVVINQTFSKFMAYDDVEISLTAPASLNLRFDTVGAEKGESVVTGDALKWVWKYQNKNPEIFLPNQPPSPNTFASVHISSFKDNSDELAALQKQASSMPAPPIPVIQRCQVLPGNPNDGPDAMAAFSVEISNFFWSSDHFLMREINDWNTPTCVFDDGRPRVAVIRDGYDQAFGRESDWSKSLARVEYLKKKYPNEAFAAMAEVRYWSAYAWNARGGGYASSVSDDGWKLFRERLEKSEMVLLDTKPYAAQLPGWYDEMINVQSSLGRPEEERDQVFLEGVKRYPTYYPIYFTMLNYLLPKWGGTWRTVDNLALWSVEHTRAQEGTTMYARLYWVVSGDPKVNLFKDTFASWPKMKRGFEDMMARHPKSKWNLNNFARFACMAGDKQTFLKLRAEIGKDVFDGAWPQATSLDLCETKFGYAQ